jgi:hypothetical protein
MPEVTACPVLQQVARETGKTLNQVRVWGWCAACVRAAPCTSDECAARNRLAPLDACLWIVSCVLHRTCAASQVLLKYNLQRGVPVIPKATSRDHLAENLAGMFSWRLTNHQKVRRGCATAGRVGVSARALHSSRGMARRMWWLRGSHGACTACPVPPALH